MVVAGPGAGKTVALKKAQYEHGKQLCNRWMNDGIEIPFGTTLQTIAEAISKVKRDVERILQGL